jgi:hypothetical protein
VESEHVKVKNSAAWASEASRMLRKDVVPKLWLYASNRFPVALATALK